LAGKHHILRLDAENTFEIVLQRQKYFSKMTTVNGWRQGTAVVFLKNSIDGDSVVGFGTFEDAEKYVDMCTDDKVICEETKNKFLIKLSKLAEIIPPKLVKETAIVNLGFTGKVLHGKSLSDQQLKTIFK
jgi:hypothetical protein